MKKINIIPFFKGTLILLTSVLFSCSDDDTSDTGNETNCTNVSVSDAEIISYVQNGEGIDASFETNLVSLLHNNINVSDFQTAKAFYQRLGFVPPFPFDLNVDVSDPNEALGLNLEPYKLIAAPMFSPDVFLVDLIEYTSPFNPEAPNDDINDLGLSALSLKTDNLKSDMAVFDENNISYTLLSDTEFYT